MNEFLQFPANFLWGVATSAHQIEGQNINSDWWAWEMEKSKISSDIIGSLVRNDRASSSFRPRCQLSKIEPSGKATDHWNRYKEDIGLMKELHVNAYRCSIEWAKIEPYDGGWNQDAVDHYRQEFTALRDAGMTLAVTLHHFTLPLWAAKKGGWANREVASRFVRFAEFSFSAFHEFTEYWVTINEPLIYAAKSYLQGEWPPKKHNLFLFLTVLRNQIWAHRVIFQRFHARDTYCQVGIVKNNQYFEPLRRWSPFDHVSVLLADKFWNRWFLDRLNRKFDFIGLNYYFHNRIQFPYMARNENRVVSDMGWEIYPQGIEKVLVDLARYNRPILITENGVADRDDRIRKEFIRGHLYYIHRAIQKGANVKGYFHWSLLDNFEWSEGFRPRFGLYEVDYETMERKARPSALYYAQICKNNRLEA